MSSWLVWGVFAIAAVLLGWIGYHFTVRTLRFVTAGFALAVAMLVTRYGVTHPAGAPTDLVNAFTRGMDNSVPPSCSPCWVAGFSHTAGLYGLSSLPSWYCISGA
jgi:hypothetical protein